MTLILLVLGGVIFPGPHRALWGVGQRRWH